MLVGILYCVFTGSVATVVLDPSLYLSPRPPLTDIRGDIATTNLWSWFSSNYSSNTSTSTPYGQDYSLMKSKGKENSRERRQMPKAKLFWPPIRSLHYSVGAGDIQVPLTFSLSGIYGKYAASSVGTGVIGSSYGTISKTRDTPISGLAVSRYASYGAYPSLRIYSGENGPAWSGWGNGKWGHYGKG